MRSICIKQHSQMKSILDICDEEISKNDFISITLIGEGKSVNKTISIAEILKNKYPNLSQLSRLEPNELLEPKLIIEINHKCEDR